MTNKLTIALVAAATVGLASPAFSQASVPNSSSLGTGDLLPFAYPVTTEHSARQIQRPVIRRQHLTTGALSAYASEPYAYSLYSDTPVTTGGGTLGYNQGLTNPNY